MTMQIRTEQALFGYDEGHRLLSFSRPIPAETQRLLRTATDAAFEGSATTFLSILPVPAENAQAFIRTWPADDWNRPGSVWSHVLLVGHSDLSRMTGFGAISSAFRRPQPQDGVLNDEALAGYRRPLNLHGDKLIGLPRVDPTTLSDLVRAVYSTDSPVQFRVKEVRDFEKVLLAMTEQQWPRLRRTFSCRTRQRPTRANFDLELVERLPKPISTVPLVDHDPGNLGTWMSRLVRDMLQPDETFRVFLRLGGTESRHGRTDIAPLVDLYDRIDRPRPDVVTTAIFVRNFFPSPAEQTLVKRALFGKLGSERFGGWPGSESERLLGALSAAPALDLKDVQFGNRLARLAMSPGGAALVGQMDLEALPLEAIEPIVAEVAGAVDLQAAVALTKALPDLGALVVSRRPELLGQPGIWASVDNVLLLDLLNLQVDTIVTVAIDELLEHGAVEPLAAITSAEPSRWWELLGIVGSRSDLHHLIDGAETLRAVLTRIGSAALGSPPAEGLNAPGDLVALALTADLSVGLWRRAPAKAWAAALTDLDQIPYTSLVSQRLYVVALASAMQSNSAKVRTAGWQRCFGYLHDALLDTSFDHEAWRLLSNVLPAGSDWDRCSRLRRGAAWEARRDEWQPQAVARLVKESMPFQNDMIELINARSQKKKDHWLRTVLRLLE